MDFFKDSTNTLSVVSTLILSMVYSADFYTPGNYDYFDQPIRKTLFEHCMYSVFVIGNTLGFFASLIVVVALIWSQLGDLNLVLASVKLAMPLLALALTMVSLTFTAGVYLTLIRITWLSCFVLVVGFSSFYTFFLLLAPLYIPTYSLNQRVIRYMFRYPLYLLMKATLSDPK